MVWILRTTPNYISSQFFYLPSCKLLLQMKSWASISCLQELITWTSFIFSPFTHCIRSKGFMLIPFLKKIFVLCVWVFPLHVYLFTECKPRPEEAIKKVSNSPIRLIKDTLGLLFTSEEDRKRSSKFPFFILEVVHWNNYCHKSIRIKRVWSKL